MNNSNLEFRKIKSLKFLYEINENGTILRNVKSKKQTKIFLDMHHSRKGYYAAFVHIGGRKNPEYKRVMIANVVAECWLGDKPVGLEVDHIDRNSHNNDYRNLRYATKSEQMKNRDHSKISQKGKENLEKARQDRMIGIIAVKENIKKEFCSIAECSRILADEYKKTYEHIRHKLKSRRSHIYDYDIIYLNAETRHGGSKEQGIVHVM